MVKYLLLIWLQFSITDGIIMVLDELALVSEAERSDFDEQFFGAKKYTISNTVAVHGL
jgi:hypothetical protein